MFDALFKNLKPAHLRVSLSGTPVGLFETLYRGEAWAFLYESLESPAKRGRYSFIGGRPFMRFQSRGKDIRLITNGTVQNMQGDPFEVLKRFVYSGIRPPGVLPFSGGAVGTVAYDAVRLIETLPEKHRGTASVHDLDFMFPSELVVFDHLENTADVIVYAPEGGSSNAGQIAEKIADQVQVPASPSRQFSADIPPIAAGSLNSGFSKEAFCRAVGKARDYIRAGDAFQVVLSRKMSFPFLADPLATYKRLRATNPSPYMYFLRLGERHVLGSSPEILVKLEGKTVCSRPLAGTRPRGRTEAEDLALEAELVRDEKEMAEHVMLVDLARNDLGRVCEYGSVRPSGLFEVERYSKVMHLVSNVEGKLKQGRDAFDVFRACFPAGTVSGAPKVRAMEIIDELEPEVRGPYAGSIGYFGYSGNMDMCIAIRMLTVENGRAAVQAGAGIVADSDPEKEYAESLNKARAVLAAAGIITD
jgi:anthranilate synthase component I